MAFSPASSLRSDGTPKIHTIAIAMKAHRNLKPEPFLYAIQHLVERKDCRVMVICCLSKLQDPMGVDHPIDTTAFTGINPQILEKAINTQMLNVNYFLDKRGFRAALESKRVGLDIQILTGPNSEEILVQAATSLQPSWVVVDPSFFGHRHKLKQKLGNSCSLAFIGADGPLSHEIHINDRSIWPEDPETADEPEVDILPEEIPKQQRSQDRVKRSHSSRTTTRAGTSETSAVNCCNGWFSFRLGSSSAKSRNVVESEHTTRMEIRPGDGSAKG